MTRKSNKQDFPTRQDEKKGEKGRQDGKKGEKREKIHIPKPAGAKHSSRLNLRLPEEIVDQVKRAAAERQMSLNQYVLWRLAS